MLTNADMAKILVEDFENRPDTKVRKRVEKLLTYSTDKVFECANKGKTYTTIRAWIFNPKATELFIKGLEELGFHVTLYSIFFNYHEIKISWEK